MGHCVGGWLCGLGLRPGWSGLSGSFAVRLVRWCAYVFGGGGVLLLVMRCETEYSVVGSSGVFV